VAPVIFKRNLLRTSSLTAASPASSSRRKKQSLRSSAIWQRLDGYQQNIVSEAIEQKHFGVFSEQGTGKTWIAAGIIESVLGEGNIGLCVVPLNNIETTWVDVLKKIPHLRIVRSLEELHKAILRENDRAQRAPILLLLHYEAVNPLIKKLRKVKFTIIIYDESHKLKDRGSLQSRSAAKLRDSAIYKIVLSGTPLEKQPQDAWAQFRFFATEVFGIRWKDFEEEYLEEIPDLLHDKNGRLKYRPGSMQFKRALWKMGILRKKRAFREDRLDDFLEHIRPYAVRIDADDVLKLPPMHLLQVPLQMRGRQARDYEDIAEGGVLRLGDDRITCALKVTKGVKLHQICGGYVLTDNDNVYESGRTKLRAALRIIKSERPPIVIFCRYLEEAWSLRDEVRKHYPDWVVKTYTGKTRRDMRTGIKLDFQEGKIDVLICQIRTGGVGIDLFRSHVGIMYSTTYSFIDFDQAIKRLRRRGQKYAVKMYLLFILGTIDEEIYDAVVSKRRLTTRILSTLIRRKQSWRKMVRTTNSVLRRLPRTSAFKRHQFASRCASTKSRRTKTASMAGTTARPTMRSRRN
jgi:SNF2 family DNA or RNA helicase